MKLNLDLMTREEMLLVALDNRVEHQYTTEELWDEDHNYVVCNRNGYMEYSNGEEVLEDEDLPEDGWFECTGYDESDEEDSYCDSGIYNDCRRQMTYDDPLYDGEDEY